MGLFTRSTPEEEVPETVSIAPTEDDMKSEHSRRGFFGRRRDSSPAADTLASRRTNDTMTTAHSRQTMDSNSPRRRGTLLHRGARDQEDPSITAARERVISAEQAERDADRYLYQARNAVKEAREHVKKLEAEAAEEARLAKIKQGRARDISKRARPLGRHDRF